MNRAEIKRRHDAARAQARFLGCAGFSNRDVREVDVAVYVATAEDLQDAIVEFFKVRVCPRTPEEWNAVTSELFDASQRLHNIRLKDS